MLRNLRTFQKLSFANNLIKNIRAMYTKSTDIQINYFPKEFLQKEVSQALGIKYLSVCEQSEEQILRKKMYRGVIVGKVDRLFISIPTKAPNQNRYYNIHYLLGPGSPFTTLTREALSILNQIKQNSDYNYNQQIILDKPYHIGNAQILVQQSNPDKEKDFVAFPCKNANSLGMNFMASFKQAILKTQIKNKQFILELRKQDPLNENKEIN